VDGVPLVVFEPLAPAFLRYNTRCGSSLLQYSFQMQHSFCLLLGFLASSHDVLNILKPTILFAIMTGCGKTQLVQPIAKVEAAIPQVSVITVMGFLRCHRIGDIREVTLHIDHY
jgi:hypothetical protein